MENSELGNFFPDGFMGLNKFHHLYFPNARFEFCPNSNDIRIYVRFSLSVGVSNTDPMINSADIYSRIEAHIESLALGSRKPVNLYEPLEYILSLGGKRARPTLTLLCYQAVTGAEPDEALDLAVGLELFHNFTLMHDDIMDRAPVRRGQPTVHKVWDTNTAILSADAMFVLAMDLISRNFPSHTGTLLQVFNEVALGVCEGQMEDMNLTEAEDGDIPDYLEMIRKKTAVLLGGAMKMGAVAADADSETADLFYVVGENLGLAFQLQDDLMDVYPPEGFGKQIGGDIIEGKKTYLYLVALKKSRPESQSVLRSRAGVEIPAEGKVREVLEIYARTEVKEETEALIETCISKAFAAADKLSDLPGYAALIEYLDMLGRRKS